MAEKPLFGRFIERPDIDSQLVKFDTSTTEVVYTSKWAEVLGAQGIKCRTWKLDNSDGGVDGADILIEAGGFTPIQLVNAANVVVDIPESGKADCVVMDLDGDIHVHHFDVEHAHQMVWTAGMIVTWIAQTEVRLTEFECPSFTEDMFKTIPDDASEYEGRSMTEFIAQVMQLRSQSKNW